MKESEETKDAEWLRDGRLVYRLQQAGWKKGQAVMENRTTINFAGDGAEELAVEVQAFLNQADKEA